MWMRVLVDLLRAIRFFREDIRAVPLVCFHHRRGRQARGMVDPATSAVLLLEHPCILIPFEIFPLSYRYRHFVIHSIPTNDLVVCRGIDLHREYCSHSCWELERE